MRKIEKNAISKLAHQLGTKPVPEDWRGMDAVWQFIEMVKDDGSVIIIKVDGERVNAQDNGKYTVLISGENLKGETIRIDSYTLEDALTFAIITYAERYWGFMNA